MAERRMFAKTIIDSDAFLEMPMSARLLYYDLGMRADDDGFINSPNKIMRTIGATKDDMNILIARKFVIPFDSGVVVIKAWRINNYLRADRYHSTTYRDEKSQLTVEPSGMYTAEFEVGIPHGIPVVHPDKNSIDKISKEESNKLSGKPDAGQKEEYGEDIKTIIAYLNEKAKKNYRPSSEANKKLIRARLKEGYTVSDFQKVIDIKTIEWLGTSQEQYLRPETLFCLKHFESYLNQNNASQVKQNTNQQKNISAMAEIIKELEAKGE